MCNNRFRTTLHLNKFHESYYKPIFVLQKMYSVLQYFTDLHGDKRNETNILHPRCLLIITHDS